MADRMVPVGDGRDGVGDGRRLAEAPPAGLRSRPWNGVDLVALDLETGEGSNGETVSSFGLVPIRRGRVVMSGARLLSVRPLPRVRETLAAILHRAYIVSWSAEAAAAFLDRVLGGGQAWWLGRTIDLASLASVADEPRHGAGEAGLEGLQAAAQRYRIPAPESSDALDGALTTAQLFLSLATKLARVGRRDVGALLDVDVQRGPQPSLL